MRINVAVPEAHVDAPVLDAALESVTRLNEQLLKSGQVMPFDRALHHGIKWKPEPPGQEHFDHAGIVQRRKWGDCDDLAPWHAASLRHSGEDEGATAVAKRSGPQRWHAVVQRSDGTIDDPSRRAGMGQHTAVGQLAPTLPLMRDPCPPGVHGAYIIRPQIALRPVRGAYQARADLPWYWREHLDDKQSPTDVAMTALHTAPLASSALTGAIDGVCLLGECAGFAHDDDITKMSAVADLCAGYPFRQVQEMYGDDAAYGAKEVVGSFWSALKSVASPVASLARQAVKFVPGVGPVIDTGLSAAEKAYAAARGGGAAPTRVAPGFAAVEPGHGMHCTFY